MYGIRRTPANKGRLAQRWPVSASVRIYTRGMTPPGVRRPVFWPQPGTILPLELVADAELAMAKLRQAADVELERAALNSAVAE